MPPNSVTHLCRTVLSANDGAASTDVDALGERLRTGRNLDGKRWSELFSESDIRVEGRALIAKLRGPGTGSFQLLGDTLLRHK